LNFDIIVVGASSSGLYAAALLAQAGKRVGVFERQVENAPSRRTYIITPQIKEFLNDIPVEAELCGTRIISVEAANSSVDIFLSESDLIIERNQLSKALQSRAVTAGAEVYTGFHFLRFEQNDTQTKLIFASAGNEFSATASFVIGADGLKSQTAKAAEMPLPTSVSIVQAEIKLPEDWEPSVTKVWFDVDDTPFFYWLIPESGDSGVFGLAGHNANQNRKLLDRKLDRFGLQAFGYQASQVAMHHPGFIPWGRVGTLPIYLVGDAAAQVKVTTVGGTVTGFWGAYAATQSILNGTSYARELRLLKRELDLHWWIRYLLERLDNSGYADLIRCITPSVQRFLGRQNRDQMARAFWQLPIREPRLLLLGLRILFKILLSRPEPFPSSHIKPEVGD
jgi:flavin-dependent dehydrogenase